MFRCFLLLYLIAFIPPTSRRCTQSTPSSNTRSVGLARYAKVDAKVDHLSPYIQLVHYVVFRLFSKSLHDDLPVLFPWFVCRIYPRGCAHISSSCPSTDNVWQFAIVIHHQNRFTPAPNIFIKNVSSSCLATFVKGASFAM